MIYDKEVFSYFQIGFSPRYLIARMELMTIPVMVIVDRRTMSPDLHEMCWTKTSTISLLPF